MTGTSRANDHPQRASASHRQRSGQVTRADARHQRVRRGALHQRATSIRDVARRRKSYRLTDDAVAGLDALATRHRVTVTALLEALGTLGRHATPAIEEVLDEAHRIDVERRSRRG